LGIRIAVVRFHFLPAVNITFTDADLRPLVESIVVSTLEKFEADQEGIGERLAFTEPEAAALLGLRPHVLRDARLRGEIEASRVGKRLLYEKAEILRFLRQRRSL
jgi:hypothetical protein